MLPVYNYNAWILRVIDGDSLEVRVDLGFKLYFEMELRIGHINAPELSTPEGKVAKAGMIRLLGTLPLTVQIHTSKPGRPMEKYGRWLADVTLEGNKNLATEMLINGWAIPYEG